MSVDADLCNLNIAAIFNENLTDDIDAAAGGYYKLRYQVIARDDESGPLRQKLPNRVRA